MKKGKALAAIICFFWFALLITGAAQEGTVIKTVEENASENKIPKLTIWVDSGNELEVRQALAQYVSFSRRYGDIYPQISWELLDKSYLTPQQFCRELEQEIKAGGGPDLIYMNEYNGISPQYFMEKGYLMELGDITSKNIVGGNWKYLTGVLEAGQIEGLQYVFPVYTQCPVVFGMEDVLGTAGLHIEEKNRQSLSSFLESLILASHESGKQIFDDAAAVDWIEAYCMPQEDEPAGNDLAELEELLQEVRKLSGQSDGFFSPYEKLSSGECLLSGCALESIQKMSQNLGMLDKEKTVSFMPIPSWDGEIRAVITHSAAVNVNTDYPAETAALVRMFRESYINDGIIREKYLPADGEKESWSSVLAGSSSSESEIYGKKGRSISSSDKLSRDFKKFTWGSITDAVFQFTPSVYKNGMGYVDVPDEKEVLTVIFEDRGMGTAYPIYQWLQNTVEECRDTQQLHIELIGIPMESLIFSMGWESSCADIVLCWDGIFRQESVRSDVEPYFSDLAPFLSDEAENLSVIQTGDGKIKGIVFGYQSIDESKASIGRIFSVTEQCERKEQAVDFCLAALQNELYKEAVEMVGFQSIG